MSDETKREILADLMKLNEKYNPLRKTPPITDIRKVNVRKNQKNLIKSGELIIKFYKKFMRKYSKYDYSIIIIVKKFLEEKVYKASEYIANKNYFGLSVLCIPQDAKIGDPTELEKLISLVAKNI